MALESKPLFHPEVIRQQVRAFNLPERADDFKETALLPDFVSDIFCGLLGYKRPARSGEI